MMDLSYNPFHSSQYSPVQYGRALIFNNPLMEDIDLTCRVPSQVPISLKNQLGSFHYMANPFFSDFRDPILNDINRENGAINHLNCHYRFAENGEPQPSPIKSELQTSHGSFLWSTNLKAKSSELESQSSGQHFIANNKLENHPKNEIATSCKETNTKARSFSSQPELSFPKNDMERVRSAFEVYFYTEDWWGMPTNFNEIEMTLIKIFLIKKLIHDNNRAKRYQQIVNLKSPNLLHFMRQNPPINRKNVIKMNVFVKIWNCLRQKHKGQFWARYFAQIKHPDIRLCKLNERENISSYFNINDKMYALCFESDVFRQDFMEILRSPEFFDSQLENSKQHFYVAFSNWTAKVVAFVAKTSSVFFGHERMPEIQFGLSKADLQAAPSLFEKLMRA